MNFERGTGVDQSWLSDREVDSVRWSEGKLTKEIVHYYIVSIINYLRKKSIFYVFLNMQRILMKI